MPVTWIGWVHFGLALAAMVIGGAVAVGRKGTPRHRWMGRSYGGLMLAVNGTAFMMYGLFGRFGPFHIAAVLSLVTVVAGWVPVRVRRSRSRRWIEPHAYFMGGSYVGLLAAAAAETLSRVPDSPFWPMVIGASIAVSVVGVTIMLRRLPATLRPYPR